MTILSLQAYAALDKVATWLEAGAPHVKMENGRDIAEFDMEYGVAQGDCGTTCCIAGAVVQFEGLGKLQFGVIPGSFFESRISSTQDKGAGDLAEEYLGLDPEDATALFLPWETLHDPEDLTVFNDPELAAGVLRHFMATGVVDWATPLGMEAIDEEE